MFGCCGAERKKFVTASGEVDQHRLDAVLDEGREQGWSEVRADCVSECSCCCHHDGVDVLC